MSTALTRSRSVSSPAKATARQPALQMKVFVSDATGRDFLAAKARTHLNLPLTDVQRAALGQWHLWRRQSSSHECAACGTALSVPRRMVVQQTGAPKVVVVNGQRWMDADRRYFALCAGCGRGSHGAMITAVRRGQVRGLGAPRLSVARRRAAAGGPAGTGAAV
jgi:hypothetical protein